MRLSEKAFSVDGEKPKKKRSFVMYLLKELKNDFIGFCDTHLDVILAIAAIAWIEGNYECHN